MAKKVPVTSVTPASKVKATSKAQQARARKLVGAIAAATPVGQTVKTATTIAKLAKTAKAVKVAEKAKQAAKTEKIASNSVKAKAGMTAKERAIKNAAETMKVTGAKSGGTSSLYSAITSAGNSVNKSMGMKTPTIKIKSGENVKSAASSKRRLASYTPNPERLPNLIKIDSAKGNSVKKTAYRPNKRTSK